jgi:SAM-dependent methyltransferase
VASLSFDRVADRYDETRGGEARGTKLAATLAPLVQGERVLEVGIGTGIVAGALRAAGHHVVGVDLSPLMLRRAFDRLGPSVAVADGHHLPAAADAVDTVIFVWVLHVVDDPGAALAEAARVLRPGGRLLAHLAGWVLDDEGDDVSVAQHGLDTITGRPRQTTTQIRSLVDAAGLEELGVHVTTRDTLARSPNRAADEIESRSWSGLWGVADDVWAEHVVPIISSLRALPEPDTPRAISGYQETLVARKR